MRTMGLEVTSSTRKRVVPRLRLCCSAIAVFCMAFASQSYAATIVDFDNVNSGSAWFTQVPSPYEEEGVVITNTATVSALPIIAVINTQTTGTPYLVALDHRLDLVFTASEDGMAVSLDSIDLIDLNSSMPQTITFLGTRFDDTTVSESMTTDGLSDLLGDGGAPETHLFTTLSAAPFKSIAVSINSFQMGIDNIAVRLVSPTSAQVPEPATGVIAVLLGVAGYIGLRRRSQQ